jgi:hypothetical protein
MPGSQRTDRERLLMFLATLVLLVASLIALLWPREEVGRRFVEGGGNVVTYDDHLGVRLLVAAAGIGIAWAIFWIVRRPSKATGPTRS